MRPVLVAIVLVALLAPCAHSQPPYVGDYNMELRDGEHVDCELMIERLTDLGANTYMWLIWHSPNDWDDLHTFLPMADEAGISVWVYLVPPSETAATHSQFPYSEPFRLDYVRWAEAIAKLSLEHDNLVGYVIDDFWGNVNPRWFTPESISEMVEAGRAINPDIKFYPLMYFRQIGARFARMLGTVVDGVVAAYPDDRDTVIGALRYLNDDYTLAPHGTVTFPWDHTSRAGDRGFLTQTAPVTDAENASLRFHFEDDFKGPTSGYHFMQLRVDEAVVWQEDVAGHDDGTAEVDLSDAVADREEVTIALGIYDVKGVGNFGVSAAFTELEAEGLDLQPIADEDAWTEDMRGDFVTALSPGIEGQGQFSLPLILMPSGSRGAYEKRNNEEATPERIAAKYEMCLDLVREGRIEGVVSYCLNKRPGSEDFAAVAEVIEQFHAAGDGAAK